MDELWALGNEHVQARTNYGITSLANITDCTLRCGHYGACKRHDCVSTLTLCPRYDAYHSYPIHINCRFDARQPVILLPFVKSVHALKSMSV